MQTIKEVLNTKWCARILDRVYAMQSAYKGTFMNKLLERIRAQIHMELRNRPEYTSAQDKDAVVDKVINNFTNVELLTIMAHVQ